jgi:hypothetical protein
VLIIRDGVRRRPSLEERVDERRGGGSTEQDHVKLQIERGDSGSVALILLATA